MVTYGDVARVADLRGVERPDPDEADRDAAVDFMTTVTGRRSDDSSEGPVASTWFPEAAAHQSIARLDEIVDDLGWNPLAIDRFVELSVLPARTTVLEGSFDADDLDDAADEAEDGVWVVGNPDNDAYETDVDNTTAARRLGESLWMSLDGSTLTVSKAPDTLETATSGDETLGDDPVFAALADALDVHDPHAAVLSGATGTVGGSAAMTAEECEAMASDALVEPPTGIATGQATDDEDLVVVLALAHADAEAAEANADRVESIISDGVVTLTNQPWTEIATLEGVEVVDDTTVVVELGVTATMSPSFWYDIVVNREGVVATAC